MAKNRLLFSTPVNGVTLRRGTSVVLTRRHRHHHDHEDHHHHHGNRGINIREFETIRVVADNRNSSVSSVQITLLVSGRRGREHVFRLDRFTIAPGQSFSQSYRVPGERLFIVARALDRGRSSCRRGFDTIDVAVFGHK